MKVQAYKTYVFHCLYLFDGLPNTIYWNTKLIFGQACCYIFMCMGINIRVDTQAHISLLVHLVTKLFNHFQLLNAFHIEAKDVVFQGQLYLPVALTYTSKNNIIGFKASTKCRFYFATANTIYSQPCFFYYLKNTKVGICLCRIMHDKVRMASHLLVQCIERGTQQAFIVIVKRCWQIFETACR